MKGFLPFGPTIFVLVLLVPSGTTGKWVYVRKKEGGENCASYEQNFQVNICINFVQKKKK